MTAEYELPWTPSVNHYYRHVGPRVLISRYGRRYREEVMKLVCKGGYSTFACPVEVEIDLHPLDNRRRDADNSLKSCLDALTHAGVYEDDSLIVRLIVTKHNPMPPKGMATIRIKEWNTEHSQGNADGA